MFIQLILGSSFALDAVLYDLFQFDRGQLGDKIGASEVSMVGRMRNYFFMESYSAKTKRLTSYYFGLVNNDL
jgi:hypothetical protein